MPTPPADPPLPAELAALLDQLIDAIPLVRPVPGGAECFNPGAVAFEKAKAGLVSALLPLVADGRRLREVEAERDRYRAVSIAYQSGLDYDDDSGTWYDPEDGAVVCLDEHLIQWCNADARTASRPDASSPSPTHGEASDR